jgi:hypothetical protein
MHVGIIVERFEPRNEGGNTMLERARLSQADRRFIIGRSGGCCNKCRLQVFVENEFRERATLADDAHIWAYSEDGPRGNEPGSPSDRNARENIILLCKVCHSEVDQQPLKFTTASLTNLREEHYAWIDSRLGEVYVIKPIFHYLLYLNVPRVDMYAVKNSIPLPQVDFGTAQNFHDLGIGAGRVMASYTTILNNEDILAHRVRKHDCISHFEVGYYCFIDPIDFYTVAIDKQNNLQTAWEADKSIIYRSFADWKLICQIDPRWITTSTAFVTLRSGRTQLCGLVRINRIDTEKRKVIASPLFLAQPGGLFDAY